MSRWQVRMTFEGYQDGDTSHEAVQKFKTQLGLAPEALRSEIHMTDLATRKVDEDCQGLGPDVERARLT